MTRDDVARHGILCFGGEDWWYHNRGHCDMQYMRQFARFAPVVYVNSIVMRKPNIHEGRLFLTRLRRKARSMSRGMIRVPEGFWVYSPVSAPVHHLAGARAVNRWLLRGQVRLAMRRAGLQRPLVWVNCPAASDAALRMPRIAMVYQRTDRYEEFPGVDRDEIARYDRSLKQTAELTFFSSRTLYEAEHGQCRRAVYLDHGVDFDLFAGAEADPWIPPEMRGLRHPVAGFFGGIDSHTFDMDLMAAVVGMLPEVTFVFVGKVSIDCTPLTRYSNVRMIGQRPYHEIPHYGKCFDVCLMPWNRNRWIEACNPIKLKEYLSLGKPTVSTMFPEVSRYSDLIAVAGTDAEFAVAVAQACRHHDPGYENRSRARVRGQSWEAKAYQLIGLLESGSPLQDSAAAVTPSGDTPLPTRG